MTIGTQATIEDLYHMPDGRKAEIVNGELLVMSPTGARPGYAGDEIFVSLRQYARSRGFGRAVGDNKGFRVDLPNRESFSPDASFYTGQPTGMGFFAGAPIFAAEVRSENDYGAQAERDMAAKRADYYAAGTLVVWDVDLLGQDVIAYIPPINQMCLRSTDAATLLMPSRPCLAGPCRSMISSSQPMNRPTNG